MNYRQLLSVCVIFFGPNVQAQIDRLPSEVQEVLNEVGPVWSQDIRGNIRKSAEALTPLLREASKDGVQVTRDLAYGPDPLQQFDIYRTEQTKNAPIVVFVHGGAYVRGSRNRSPEIGSNIPTYFARNGMLGVNTDYRLAPDVTWPASAEDLATLVRWLKENAARFGGDKNRIYLMGSSAGATHVATYAFNTTLHPETGPGIAGVILLSGRYRIAPPPDDPNINNVHAYFGSDPARYPEMSVINHVNDGPRIPAYIVIAEYDNPGLDVSSAELFAALCARNGACPRISRFVGHNHVSTAFSINTSGDVLGPQVVDFIESGR